jgi:hypothetical protein
MRRLTSFVLALAAAVSISGTSNAAMLIFEQGADRFGTDPALCPAPCFEINMWLQTEAGEEALPIQSIQMDVGISDGGVAADFWTPPDENNGTTDDGTVGVKYRPTSTATKQTITELPWNLSSTVAQSPAAGFDARIVHAASNPFTMTSLNATMNLSNGTGLPALTDPTCSAGELDPELCELVRTRATQGQIFLGMFKATVTGTSINVGNITGDGTLLTQEVAPLNGQSCDFVEGRCTVGAEPSGVILLGAALAGLGFLRRRS